MSWLFGGSFRSSERAANVMTLIQSAKMNGLVPQPYLRDFLERMPMPIDQTCRICCRTLGQRRSKCDGCTFKILPLCWLI